MLVENIPVSKIYKRAQKENPIGNKYNRLFVLCRTDEKIDSSRFKYTCVCECGKYTNVPLKQLKSNNTRSCGCLQIEAMTILGYKNSTIKMCMYCNKNFRIKNYMAVRFGKYCSKDCMAEGYKTKLKGVANPHYKDGRTADPLAYSRAWGKAWRDANPKLVSERNRRSRGKRKKATGEYTIKDVHNMLWNQNGNCYWCFEKLERGKRHVDHVIPLAKHGSNCVDNIVLSCIACNCQKSSLLLPDWFAKPDCRAKRKTYDTGKYSEGWDRSELANRFVCVGGS